MARFEHQGDSLLVRLSGETMKIEPWGEHSFRVRSRMMGELLDWDYALLPDKPEHGPVTVEIDAQKACIRNGNLLAVVTYDDWFRNVQVHYYNETGKLLLEEAFNYGGIKLYARRWKAKAGGDYELTVTFEGSEDEKLYGMGQYQYDFLNLKNCVIELAQHNTQASVPFLISDRGYGFFWHNPAVGHATFGKNITEWKAATTKQMDYWITAGHTPAEIEHAYARVVGTAPMMPEYGLGFWQCKLRYWNQEQLLEVAREYKRRGLPIDVIVCDFFHWPKMGDFRFEKEFFPDPKAMVDELHTMGIELMVSVWPQISTLSENYAEMREEGLLVRADRGAQVTMQWPEDSVFYDATNSRARDYVWRKCKQNYYDHGIKIFWLDEAEPEYGVYDYENYRYFMGPAEAVSNLYPQAYARGFYEGMEREGQTNIVNLVRCAWAGSQRYGALVWSGDIYSTWTDFRRQVCAGLNMSLAGIPWWTTDIGGFSEGDPADEGFRELLIRWFQWAAFCPVMRLHGDRVPSRKLHRKDGSDALFTGADNEVWSFGETAYPILKEYMLLREAMRDYTRSLMREAHELGSPVIRAMFYEFPDDAVCWDLTDQYLYGPDILVAPVLEAGATARKVYLPKGAAWTAMADGKEYAGGQWVQAPAPLAQMPVFLKNGSHKELISKISGHPEA